MIETRDDTIENRPVRWSLVAAGLLALSLVWVTRQLARADSAVTGSGLFRFAFTSSMFTEVNEKDANAAIKVWMLTVTRQRSIPVNPDPDIYSSVEELAQALRKGVVDGVGLTTEEYWRLSKHARFDRLLVATNAGRIAEEYLLLARRDSGIEKVADLRGRSLIVLRNPRMSLAEAWLDMLLLQAGLAPAAEFCGHVTFVNKPARVALPVFFHQADICLITRTSFEIMSELNPQVGRQLRVLAESPAFVPSAFGFRTDGMNSYREQMMAEIRELPNFPAGRQILTLLQADRIEEQPVSCLDSALELLTTHSRLLAARMTTNAVSGNFSLPESGRKK